LDSHIYKLCSHIHDGVPGARQVLASWVHDKGRHYVRLRVRYAYACLVL
jgi:hypothetical protein